MKKFFYCSFVYLSILVCNPIYENILPLEKYLRNNDYWSSSIKESLPKNEVRFFIFNSSNIIIDIVFTNLNHALYDPKVWRYQYTPIYDKKGNLGCFKWKYFTNQINNLKANEIIFTNYISLSISSNLIRQQMISNILRSVKNYYLRIYLMKEDGEKWPSKEKILKTGISVQIRDFDSVEYETWTLFEKEDYLQFAKVQFFYNNVSTLDKYGEYYVLTVDSYKQSDTLETLANKEPDRFKKFLKHHINERILFTKEELETGNVQKK